VKLHAVNEWAPLETVVVGTGRSMGPDPTLEEAYDPKSKEHLRAGTYPKEADVSRELEGLVRLLEARGIRVLRPTNLPDLNQVFARDVGVVIDDRCVMTRMISDRAEEWEGIAPLLSALPDHRLLQPPVGARVEGGDVMPMNGELWVGYSKPDDFKTYTTARTNEAGLDWLSDQFPDWNVRGFELRKSDVDPRANALHLDCCLSVLSQGHAIVHLPGLKNPDDQAWVKHTFGPKLLEVDAEQMYHMQCNLISTDPLHVVSCPEFDTVNAQLRTWGYEVSTTPMLETAKMEGLLRCVTMPLQRQRS
jgi:N-dimethylarginine dimethylaminohydrolase